MQPGAAPLWGESDGRRTFRCSSNQFPAPGACDLLAPVQDVTPHAWEARGGAKRRLDVKRLGDHVDRLYRAAYALCGSRDDAEDLVQETFERVLRRPRFIRHDGDVAYLLRVQRNTFLEQQRRRANRPSVPLAPEDLDWLTPAASTDAALDARAAFAAIHTLSAPLRDTIIAVDVVGLSYKEAARALRTREGTIMSRLYRARERVAEMLER
jgi:RNA polymerase sigma-70 factor (ECF subfamily)